MNSEEIKKACEKAWEGPILHHSKFCRFEVSDRPPRKGREAARVGDQWLWAIPRGFPRRKAR